MTYKLKENRALIFFNEKFTPTDNDFEGFIYVLILK